MQSKYISSLLVRLFIYIEFFKNMLVHIRAVQNTIAIVLPLFWTTEVLPR